MPRYAFEQFVHLIASTGLPYSPEAAERAARSQHVEMFLGGAISINSLLFGETAPDADNVRRYGALLLAYFPSKDSQGEYQASLIRFYSTDLPGAGWELSTHALNEVTLTSDGVYVTNASDPKRDMVAPWQGYAGASIGGLPIVNHYSEINYRTE